MNRTYIGGIVFAVVFITASALVLNLPVSAQSENLAVFSESASEDDKILAEYDESRETGQIREDTGMSGMPCENGEQFARWYESYCASAREDGNEQETGEETESRRAEEPDCFEEKHLEVLPSEEVQMETEVPSYAVGDEVLNPELQEYLYQRLSEHGIEWFMPYAIMVAYQESRFDQYAVNPHNHIDMGLFQFRLPYYEGTDIFNPYEQIDIFTEQMANRANMGLDVYEMISRHNVSDYGTYNHEYVAQVMSHQSNLRKVGN